MSSPDDPRVDIVAEALDSAAHMDVAEVGDPRYINPRARDLLARLDAAVPAPEKPGRLLNAMQRIAKHVGREGTSLESIVDRCAYLAEQDAARTASPPEPNVSGPELGYRGDSASGADSDAARTASPARAEVAEQGPCDSWLAPGFLAGGSPAYCERGAGHPTPIEGVADAVHAEHESQLFWVDDAQDARRGHPTASPSPENAFADEVARKVIRESDTLPREGESLVACALRAVHADTDPEDVARFTDPRDRAARVLHSLYDPGVSWSACERAATALYLSGVLAALPAPAAPDREDATPDVMPVGETECGTCGETVDVVMAPVTVEHTWSIEDGPGSENPPSLCPGARVDHGDSARLGQHDEVDGSFYERWEIEEGYGPTRQVPRTPRAGGGELPRTWWSPTDGLIQDVPTALYVHVASGEPLVSVPTDGIELRPVDRITGTTGEAGAASDG